MDDNDHASDASAFRDQREREQRTRRLNLNLLYPLDAILRAPTLTQAGLMIALSQPAMSLALRKLRDHFDDELVIYSNATRHLTPLANALRPRVARLLREADATLSTEARFDPGTARRTIRLAAPEPIEIMYLTRVGTAMLADGPGLDVRFLPFDYGSIDALFSGGTDIAVVPETMLDGSPHHIPLFESSLSCLVCEDHPTIRDRMTLEQYRDARHAALSPSMEKLAMMGDPIHPLSVARQVVIRTARYAALPNLIIGTDLIVTLNNWLAQYLAYHYPLRVVSIPFPVQPVSLFAHWEAHRHNDPVIRWSVSHLTRVRDAMIGGAISNADRRIINGDL